MKYDQLDEDKLHEQNELFEISTPIFSNIDKQLFKIMNQILI